jgi:dTDP-glucose 4,6-dehydratase
MKLLVCGGAGFIGSNFVRIRARDHGDEVVVLDKLTYAGRRENLQDVEHGFVHGAIEDPAAVAEAMDGVDAVVNFAAETHVDRSIADPDAFVRTQVQGTYVLLEAARQRGVRFLQVSTDEVYGSIDEGSFTETSPLAPSSPYSATKAGADLLVSSYLHTYGLEAVICRGSNSYGPYQYPEKLIPLMVLNALHGDALPVYGDGMNVRNWLFVEDFARAIGLQRRRPRRVPEHRGRPRRRRADRRRRVAHRVRRGPSRPRPPLLAQLGQDPRPGLGAAGPLLRGPRAHGRLVSRQPVVVGAHPVGRVPGLLRAPVRARAGVAPRRGALQLGDPPRAALAHELQRVAAVLVAGLGADPRGGALARDPDGLDGEVEGVGVAHRLVDDRRAAAAAGGEPVGERAGEDVAADLVLVGLRGGRLEVLDRVGDEPLLALELLAAVVSGGRAAAAGEEPGDGDGGEHGEGARAHGGGEATYH